MSYKASDRPHRWRHCLCFTGSDLKQQPVLSCQRHKGRVQSTAAVCHFISFIVCVTLNFLSPPYELKVSWCTLLLFWHRTEHTAGEAAIFNNHSLPLTCPLMSALRYSRHDGCDACEEGMSLILLKLKLKRWLNEDDSSYNRSWQGQTSCRFQLFIMRVGVGSLWGPQ